MQLTRFVWNKSLLTEIFGTVEIGFAADEANDGNGLGSWNEKDTRGAFKGCSSELGSRELELLGRFKIDFTDVWLCCTVRGKGAGGSRVLKSISIIFKTELGISLCSVSGSLNEASTVKVGVSFEAPSAMIGRCLEDSVSACTSALFNILLAIMGFGTTGAIFDDPIVGFLHVMLPDAFRMLDNETSVPWFTATLFNIAALLSAACESFVATFDLWFKTASGLNKVLSFDTICGALDLSRRDELELPLPLWRFEHSPLFALFDLSDRFVLSRSFEWWDLCRLLEDKWCCSFDWRFPDVDEWCFSNEDDEFFSDDDEWRFSVVDDERCFSDVEDERRFLDDVDE